MEKEFKFKKIYLIFIVIFLLSAFLIQIFQYKNKAVNFVLDGNRINVIVAESEFQKRRGLGNRNDLGNFDGMIFVYPSAYKLGVVMRDMRFPIDIIWFYDGKVVDIAPNVPLEPNVKEEDLRIYFPREKANVFLELKAGWAADNDIRIGDKLTGSGLY